MNIEIRLYSPDSESHLAELTALSRQTFIDGFEKTSHPDHFKTYLAQAFAPETVRAELQSPKTVFYGVWIEGNLAGYCKLRWDRYENANAPKPALELQRIYFLEKYWNQGLGQYTLDWIQAFAQARQFKAILLLVWNQNHAARRLYFRVGFEDIGRADFQFGNEIHHDFVMCKKL
jgi:diamine N-acetyltransferase